MIQLFLVVIYIGLGFIVAGLAKSEVGSSMDDGFIVVIFWPIFLFVLVGSKILEWFGYK